MELAQPGCAGGAVGTGCPGVVDARLRLSEKGAGIRAGPSCSASVPWGPRVPGRGFRKIYLHGNSASDSDD